VDDIGTKAARIITSETVGLTIQHLFQGTINSDQFCEPKRLTMVMHRVPTATNFVTILVV
jgi:hypothetical protein